MIQVSFDNIIKNHKYANNFDRVGGREVLGDLWVMFKVHPWKDLMIFEKN